MKLLGFLLLLFLHSSQCLIWTRYSINDCCHPIALIPPATSVQCRTNASKVDIYGICSSVNTVQTCCISENRAEFPLGNNSAPNLPEYLVPVYDGSCTTTQPSSFLGHVVILSQARQAHALLYLTPHGGFYECHLNEWLIFQVPNSTNPFTIRNILLDSHLTNLSALGISTMTQNSSSINVTSWTDKPILLGSWWIQDNIQPFWALSFTLISTVWSARTLQYRTIVIPLVTGTTVVPCNSSLIKDASTCAIINRQLRIFPKPYGSLPTNTAPYSLSDAYVSTTSLEQCQQLHAYYLDDSNLLLNTQESFNSRQQSSTPFRCPNPLLKILETDSQDYFNLFTNGVNTSIGVYPPVVATQTPVTTPSLLKIPSSLELSPSSSSSPSSLDPVTESPTVNSGLIILFVILGVLVLTSVIAGLVCFGVRRRNARRLDEGNLSHDEIQYYYAFCCLPKSEPGTKESSRVGDRYSIHVDTENSELVPLDSSRSEAPKISMSDSQFNAASRLLDEMGDAFSEPTFAERPPPPKKLQNPFEDEDIFNTGHPKKD